MRTYASLFTGGGLADFGAIAAGYAPIWGVEYIPEIADVARMNGLDVLTADVLNCDPRHFIRPDLFHASPPCPNFSVAKRDGKETKLDIALAEKVAEFITVLRPQNVTIENVRAYIKSESYKIIMRSIENAGYMYGAKVLNAADSGVPQSRRRLFVQAVSGGMVPNLPAPVKHISWYAAIEDVLDTLPASKFADWQLARLPDFCNGALFTPSKYGDDLIFARANDPALTITSNRNQYSIKAFLLSGCGISGKQKIVYEQDEPSMTITASEDKRPTRAWLSQGRVVSMTPRALARFQSVPNSYILPERRTLAGKIIGNGVPCKEYADIAKSFT